MCSYILILQILKIMYWESSRRVRLCPGPAVRAQDSRSSLATYQWNHVHGAWVCFGHLVRSLEHSGSAFPHLYKSFHKNTYLWGLLWGLTGQGKCFAHYEGRLHKCVLLHTKQETACSSLRMCQDNNTSKHGTRGLGKSGNNIETLGGQRLHSRGGEELVWVQKG